MHISFMSGECIGGPLNSGDTRAPRSSSSCSTASSLSFAPLSANWLLEFKQEMKTLASAWASRMHASIVS
ncbi:hypothetical protein D3C84_989600 [compost metagenome]